MRERWTEKLNLYKFSLRGLLMVEEGGREIVHREQIRKNCGNVGAQSNFGREQGNKDHPRIPSKAVILDK